MVDRERGTTLTEVLVVLALAAMIITPLYLVLLSGYRTERTQTEKVDAEAQLERVAVRIEDDIRSGYPSDRRTVSATDELVIGRILDDDSELIVSWTFAGDELLRRSFDAASGKVISDVVLLSDTDGDRSGFRYWAADGSELKPATEVLVRCAVRVTVDLQTKVDVVDAGRTVDVSHRTGNPTAEPC